MAERRSFTITKLAWHPDGYWTANVTIGGKTVAVDRRYGSWQAYVRQQPGSRQFVRRDVLPAVAAALQEKVRPREAREHEAWARAGETGRVRARIRRAPPA